MTTTSNMGLTQSTVGTTTGPEWATNAENNLLTIDAHDHTSGKGVQLTPSSLNINADLEFNLNSATELKNVVLDNAVHASASGDTNNSVYEYDGNLYWRNASGGSVQITSGTAVNTSGGSISGMTGNAQVLFSSNSYAFKFDSSLSDPGIAKISHADIDLYKYDASGSAAKVTLKFLGSGTSAALTVPDETGTLLTTATSFAGTINVATSSSNAPINLKPNGTGHVAVGNGGASGKLTSNGAFDLVLDTNSGTNSGNITITDGANGDITIDTNGTGDINLTGGADVNIPADIGLTFGDDGEKIEGDGTDLTIASSGEININSATLDLSFQTVDVTLNNSSDALNFDSNTLSIDASGNRVGIGTAAPSATKLEVRANTGGTSASNSIVSITNGDDGTYSEALLNVKNAGNRGAKGHASGSPLVEFEFSDETAFIVDKGGNVGIGTTSIDLMGVNSDLALTLSAGTSGNVSPYLEIQGSRTSNNARFGGIMGFHQGNRVAGMVFNRADNDAHGQIAFETEGGSGATVRMTIDQDGNVGIGTTPNSLLHVSGSHASVGDPLAIIQATDNDQTGLGLMAYGSNASHRNWLVAANVDVAGSFGIGYTANDSDVPTTANVTTALSIDSAGNVGIGTTSPNFLTHGGPVLSILGGSTNNNAVIELANPNAGSGDGLGQIEFLNYDGGSSVTARSIIVGGHGGADDSSDLRFYTEPSGGSTTERMRISSNGNINIGGSPHSARRLSVHGTTNDNSENTFEVQNLAETTLFKVVNDGYIRMGALPTTSLAANMYIHTNGDVHKSTSSRRFKTNIVDTVKGLAELLNLRPVDFNSAIPTDDPDKLHTGFIAEEVADVGFDEYVTRDSENVIESVQYPAMVALCVKAIQQLSAKVTALEGA